MMACTRRRLMAVCLRLRNAYAGIVSKDCISLSGNSPALSRMAPRRAAAYMRARTLIYVAWAIMSDFNGAVSG
jgi:hypothetical protein